MKQVLLITDVDFWRQGAGHRMRILSLINYIIRHFKLTIVYIGMIDLETYNYLITAFNLKMIILKDDQLLDYRKYGELLASKIKNRNFDSVIVEFIHNTYYLNFVNGDAKFILDTIDIISNRTEEFKNFNYSKKSFEISKEAELRIFSAYEYIIAICQPDYDELIKVIPAEKVLLCPHPVPTTARRLNKNVKNIGFIASEYLPNVDGIEFFIRECWPKLILKHNVNLCLYGSICEKVNSEGVRNITKKGFVENLTDAYNEIDIIINPVRFGAGLKIKSIECLANGIPLLTTSHGARGLEPMIGKAFLVANDGPEFVTKLNVLIENPTMRRQLSQQAFRYINEIYNDEICFKPLVNAINA